MAWTDFGQKVDLTARIREILINYPEGTSILKELIQNADDARASCVRFCLDHRQHPTNDLLGPDMAAFQGPALLVYNDQEFSERDFTSISRIGDSVKREQTGKTGRFGIGFNSCYHLTDVPSFVSGSHLVIFDPHCKYLPHISSTNPGKKINFVAALSPAAQQQHHVALGQLAPYQGVYGCDLVNGKAWPHTVFRFPLRTAELAKNSNISKQAYDVPKISGLFKQLAAESHSIMLFLKAVSHIEISEWLPGEDQPQLLFTCQIPSPSTQLIAHRSLFARASSTASRSSTGNAPNPNSPARAADANTASVFELNISMQAHGAWAHSHAAQGQGSPADSSGVGAAQDATTVILPGSDGAALSKQYLISQALGTGQVAHLAQQLSAQFTVPLVPWAAVAADITPNAEGVVSPVKGQAYCFLPLPAMTGLPVHVNAFFELSSNRRDIWHGEDMAGMGAARAAWNKALLVDVAATAYTNLVVHAAKALGPGTTFDSLWPLKDVAAPWQALLKALYMRLAALPVAHTKAAGGRWLEPMHAVLPDVTCQSRPALVSALEVAGLPLIRASPERSNMWRTHFPEPPEEVTPARVRGHLRNMGLQQQAQAVSDASTAAVLLDYCLSDVHVQLANSQQLVQQLSGLRVVPKLDGAVADIHPAASTPNGPMLYLASELELQLLRDATPQLLVSCIQLGDEAVSRLWALAQLGITNIQVINTKAMAQHLLPRLLHGSQAAGAATATASGMQPAAHWGMPGSAMTKECVSLLWRWLEQQDNWQHLTLLPCLPVLPPPGQVPLPASPEGAEGTSATQLLVERASGELLPLGTSSHSTVVGIAPEQANLLCKHLMQQAAGQQQQPGTNDNDNIASVLATLSVLGVRLTDSATFPGLPVTALARSHCHPFDGPGALAALSNLGHTLGITPHRKSDLGRETAKDDGWGSLFRTVSAQACQQLRQFLLTPECLNTITKTQAAGRPASARASSGLQATLAALPIYQLASAASQESTSLCDLTGTCFLQPQGFDASLLPHVKYVVGSSPVEEALMVQHLGVRQISAAQAYKEHVIPALATLPTAECQTLTLQLLRALPGLLPATPSLAADLAQLPLVPNLAGQMCFASQLYDPRVQELAVLLDSEQAFPAPPYLDDPVVLDGLVLLGMNQVAGRDTVIQAAHYVQRCAERADAVWQALPAASTDNLPDGLPEEVAQQRAAAQEASDMAVARAKALLAFLEMEAGRLMAPAFERPTSEQANVMSAGGAAAGAGGGLRKLAGGFFARMQGALSGGPGGPEYESSGAAATSGKGQEEAAQKLLEVQRFWSQLADIRWCPVIPEPVQAGLPWKTLDSNRRTPLVPARTVRPAPDMWLASASLHVLDGECRSSALAAGLNWASALPAVVLGMQLKQLGLMHALVGYGLSDGGEQVHTDQSLAQQLAEVVPHLYRALSGLSRDDLAAAVQLLAGGPCVWVGLGFVPAHKVAFQGAMDLSPWVYVLPAELSPFKQLLKQFGATESFSAQQYIALLADMHAAARPAADTHTSKASDAGTTTVSNSAGPSAPLDPQQLSQAIAAVQALADLAASTGSGPIFVPDEKGCLVPAGQLVFNDAPWMTGSGAGGVAIGGAPGLDEGEAGGAALGMQRLVHPKISNHVAERVGVASMRRLLLAQASDSVALSLVTRTAGAGAAEAFGQSEALTTRLRHIIQNYPEGPGVLMELLQNADDAGATQLKLMLDVTQYGCSSILAPAMAALQGPAVLAYNDATFSPADFNAIARIGQDAKLSRPTSVGRFGLGFNAVYHLTDVPSFVSGEYVVLFDPHARYLPSVNLAQPGLRFAFQRANLLAQFPDAFTPYTQFGCTLREPFKGTLFRFPLRTSEVAAQSDIKPGVACKPQEVMALFNAFKAHLPHALLFLKSVRSVEVLLRVPGASQPMVLYSAHAAPMSGSGSVSSEAPGQLQAMPGTPAASLQQPIIRFLQEASSGKAGPGTDMQKLARAMVQAQNALPCSIGSMELSLKSYPEAASHMTAVLSPTSQASEDNTIDAPQVPHSAEVVEMVLERQRWLVCNALGSGTAREIAVQAANKATGVKMIPWVGVAAAIPSQLEHTQQQLDQHSGLSGEAPHSQAEADGDSQVKVQGGQAYCFLPLPIRTQLPVHVNAFFELSSNRRDIWYGADMSGSGAQRAHWNVALLRDGLAPAYARLLLDMSAELGPGPGLYRLFPPPQLAEPWSHLSQSFYHLLAKQPLVWVDAQGGRWLPPTQVVLPGDVPPSLVSLLAGLGLSIARHLPAWLETAMLSLTPGVTPLTPALVRSHLASAIGKSGGAAAVMQQLDRFGKQHAAEQLAISAESAQKASQETALTHADSVASSKVDPSHAPQAVSAALLLEYCLSDVTADAAAALSVLEAQQAEPQSSASSASFKATINLVRSMSQLDGCPLLPLQDGTLGMIHAAAAVSSLGHVQTRSVPITYLLPRSASEAGLLEPLPGRTVLAGLPAGLADSLQLLATKGVANVLPVTPASLNQHVLPAILPAAWQRKELVSWVPAHLASLSGASADAADASMNRGLSQAWLQQLWQFLSSLPDASHVLHLSDWPLLPVKGGKLASLQPVSKVLLEGDWQELLTQSLTKLGCLLLDTDILNQPSTPTARQPTAPTTPEVPADAGGGSHPLFLSDSEQGSAGARSSAVEAAPTDMEASEALSRGTTTGTSALLASAALQRVVQPPTLVGILRALRAVATSGPHTSAPRLSSMPHHPTTGSQRTAPTASIDSRAAQHSSASQSRQMWPFLESAEARQLRTYLLQEKWFTAPAEPPHPELLKLLFSLPVYEQHGSGSTTVARFSHLDQRMMFLPPEGVTSEALLDIAMPSKSLQHSAAMPQHSSTVPAASPSHIFLKCDHAGEARILTKQLGVRRMTEQDFLASHVLPLAQAGALPVEQLSSYLVHVLGMLHSFTQPALAASPAASPVHSSSPQELTKLQDILRSLPIFPVQGSQLADTGRPAAHKQPGSSLQLRSAAQLYDPRVPELGELLDPQLFFPAAELAAEKQALDMLLVLGMKNTITLEVLVVAAEAINSQYQQCVDRHPEQAQLKPGAEVPEWATPLLSRAHAVLRQLHGLCLAPSSLSATAHTEGVWHKLQQLAWCPVIASPPHTGLPWPETGQPLLAAPRVVRPPTDAWIMSATLQLLDTSSLTCSHNESDLLQPVSSGVSGTPVLAPYMCEQLGWSAAPRASVLCAQLRELGKMYPVVAKLQPAAIPTNSSEDALVPKPDAEQSFDTKAAVSDEGVNVLPDAATSQPAAAAAPSSTDDWAVFDSPATTQEQQSSNVGVSSTTGPAIPATHSDAPMHSGTDVPAASTTTRGPDVAVVAAGVHQLYAALNAACTGTQQDLVAMTFERGDAACVWVGEGFVPPARAALHGPSGAQWQPWLWRIPNEFREYSRLFSLMGVSDMFGPSHFKNALSEIASLSDGQPLSSPDLMVALQLAEAVVEAATQQGQRDDAAGSISGQEAYLPDISCVMRPASQLLFDDADWIPKDGLLMAHAALTHATAEALGVRSLRYHQQQQVAPSDISSTSGRGFGLKGKAREARVPLACLSPSQLGQVLGLQEQDTVSASVVVTFLNDLTEVADLLGVTHLQVTLDTQQHPAQSLLHPGLWQYQGPALCITLPGVEVTSEELCSLLARVASPSGNADGAEALLLRGQPVLQGLGLLAAFTITEVPQVISGSATMMWDPAGRCITRSAQEEAAAGGAAATGPRAQQYRHVDAQLPGMFPDQYGSVWAFAQGCDVKRHCNSTLLRLPLTQGGGRTSASGKTATRPALGWHTASLNTVQQALTQWQNCAARSLLFCRKLQAVSVRHLDGLKAPSTQSDTKVKAMPVTDFQAVVSWDPDKPRHTYGLRDLSTGADADALQRSGSKSNFGTKLLNAFGKVSAAVSGSSARGDGVRARQPPQQHEAILHLVISKAEASRHESWLISTNYQEVPSPRQQHTAGGAAALTGGRDVVAAVAVCLAASGEQGQQALPHIPGFHPCIHPLPLIDGSIEEVARLPAESSAAMLPRAATDASGESATAAFPQGLHGSPSAPAAGGGAHASKASSGPGHTLADLNFQVHGSFFWSRGQRGTRRLVPLLPPSDNAALAVLEDRPMHDALHQGPLAQGTQQQPQRIMPPSVRANTASGGAALAPSSHMAVRISHNKKVSEALAATWLSALRWLLSNQQHHLWAHANSPRPSGASASPLTGPGGSRTASSSGGPAAGSVPHHLTAGQQASSLHSSSAVGTAASSLTRQIYEVMMPNLAAAVAAGDEMGQACMSRMYQLAAYQPLWMLRLGQWVTLKDGFFLNPAIVEPVPQDATLSLAAHATSSTRHSHAGVAASPHEQVHDGQDALQASTEQKQPADSLAGQPHAQAAVDHTARDGAKGALLGPAALTFLHHHMPLLDVPYRVMRDLQHAQVQSVQEVSPDTVRMFLKQHHTNWSGSRLAAERGDTQASSPRGSASGSVKVQQQAGRTGGTRPSSIFASWVFTTSQLLQLLAYCTSDLALPPSSHVDTHQIVPIVDRVDARQDMQAAMPSAAGQTSGNAGWGGLQEQVPGLLGLQAGLQDLISSVNTNVNRVVDSVIEGVNRNVLQPSAPVISPSSAAADGVAPAATAGSGSVAGAWDMAKVLALKGFPVPNAAGALMALGARSQAGEDWTRAAVNSLLVLPAECGSQAHKLLPPSAHGLLLHPDAVNVLVSVQNGQASFGKPKLVLHDPVVRSAWGLRLYSFADLSRHLTDVLPATWQYQGVQPPVSGWEIPGAAPIDPSAAVSAMGLNVFSPAAGQPAAGRAADGRGGVARALAGVQAMMSHTLDRGLGVTWDPEKSDGSTMEWLQQLAALISGIVQQAPEWGDPAVRLSDLESWPLIPTIQTPVETGSNQQHTSTAKLVYFAHRAAVCVLPPDFIQPAVPLLPLTEQQPQQQAAEVPAGGAGAGNPLMLSDTNVKPTVDLLCQAAPSPAWALVLRVLALSGCPVLDPRFHKHLAPLCVPHITLTGPITVFVQKLRWANEVLARSKASAASSRQQTVDAQVPLLGLSTNGWDAALRERLVALLADNLPSSLSPEDIAFLKVLPIYPSLSGMPVPLSQQSSEEGAPTPAACPAGLLDQLPGLVEALPQDALALLIEARPSLARLYELLGLTTLTVAGLLGKVVVPLLDQLPDTVQAHVLTYIQYNWSSLKNDSSLIAALKDCAFVLSDAAASDNSDVMLYKPGELYDPQHELYGPVYQGCGKFPGGQYAFPAWLQVLRDVGLVHTVKTTNFLAAAQHVAQRGTLLADTGIAPAERGAIMRAAEATLGYLGRNFHMLLGRDFYTALSEVAFAPATLGIPGSPNATHLLAKFSDGAAPKDWPLCWTVLPIISLPDGWQVPSSVSPYFRLRSPPPLAMVTQHLKNVGSEGGEQVLGSWPSTAQLSVEAAFDHVLDHLSNEGLTDTQLAPLRNVALLPVGNASRLVAPSHTCVRLKEDLAPLAYELPSRLIKRLDLLKSLGCKETATAQWLLDLLHLEVQRVGGAPLNTNQRTAVIRALCILHGLSSHGDAAAIAAARAAGKLLVLTTDGRLCAPHDVVVVSFSQSHLLGRVRADSAGLRFVHPQLPRNVAMWLGCAELQDKVEEELDMSHSLQSVDTVGSIRLDATRQLLASSRFIEACYAAVQAHAHTIKGLEPLSVKQVAAALRRLSSELVFVRSLATRVVIRDSQQDVTRRSETGFADIDFLNRDSPSARVYEFYDRRTSRQYIAEPPAGLPETFVSHLLAVAVSRVLGSGLCVLPLHPLFSCDTERIRELQPVLLPGGWDASLEAAGRAGEPGAPLHPSDAALLLLKPLRRYAAGEVVAVQRKTVLAAATEAGVADRLLMRPQAGDAAADAALKRATAKPPVDTASEDPAANTQPAVAMTDTVDDTRDMVYARVASDAAPQGTVPLYQIPLEVEPGMVLPVMSIHIHSFRSPTPQDTPPTATTGSGAIQQQGGAGPRQRDGDSRSIPPPPRQPIHAAAPSVQPPAAASGSSQPVITAVTPTEGAAQLVGAVKDLLGAAGLPLDMDRAVLLEKAAGVQLALAEAQEQLQQARTTLAAQQHELEASKGSWQCKICFTRDVDASFTGCGHMMCHTCAAGLDRCPVCRKRSQLIRLYK